MAYITQEEKKEIANQLKAFIPKTWKWSIAVKHYSVLVLTIASAPASDLGQYDGKDVQANTYYPEYHFEGEALATIKKIISVLNHKNYNNSDSQSDYFEVGYYVNINIGKWNKPFMAIA